MIKKTQWSLILICICFFAFAGNPTESYKSAAANAGTTNANKIQEKFNRGAFSLRPFGFMENKGQVTGPDGLVFDEAKFEFQQGNTKIFLLEKGIAYQFTKTHYPNGYLDLLNKKNGSKNYEELEKLQK